MNLYRQITPQILGLIQKASHPLLISHEKPDGDTLGASLALANYLSKNNQQYKHFCINQPAGYFSFLPKIENIISDYASIKLHEHDLIITIDCGAIHRTGIAADLLKVNIPIINIDHHQSNDNFGQYNLVIPDASSTSEIIYKFFISNGIGIDKYMATSLLTGIISDTMNFTNAATTQDSLEIAAKLLNNGARITQILSNITQSKSLASLKVWGKILSRLEIEPTNNFAHTIITLEDLTQEQISQDDLDGLANFLSLLQDAEFILLLTEENENHIKGSLRTMKNNIDVAQIASHFGGGGHKKAAGFKVEKSTMGADADWKNYIINAIITKLKSASG